MKQGQATHSGSGATKPAITAHAVSPGAVSRLGTIQGPGTEPKALCKTIGVFAPSTKTTIHHCGSQGKR